jgi:hypothetical protein
MKISAILSAVLLLLAGVVYLNVSAQAATQASKVIAMTGDKEAVWFATDQNELVYCWWSDSPARLDKRAKCRVLNRSRVDRLQ